MTLTDAHEAIRRRFDERAPHYDESDMHRAVAAAVARFVSLVGVDTVLDVATGTGLVLRAVRDRSAAETSKAAPGGDVWAPRFIGVDLSPGMLAVAARELPHATLLVADAAALPLPDDSIDLVICATALHMIPDTEAAVAEWRRVLRPHGRAVTATFARPDRGARNTHPYPVNHAPFASPEDLARTVAALGFSLGRFETWTNAQDNVLIAELALDPDATATPDTVPEEGRP